MSRAVTTTQYPYIFDVTDQRSELPERPPIPFVPPVGSAPYPARYVTGSEPWRLKDDETHEDGVPVGSFFRNAALYGGAGGGNLDTINDSIAASVPAGVGVLVRLDYGVYHVTNLIDYNGDVNNPNYLGTTDKQRKILGYIGKPRLYDSFGQVTNETIIQVDETMISSTPNALQHSISRVPPQLNSITSIYFSNTSAPAPAFWSGITFDGTLQIPYTTLTTGAQAKTNRYPGNPSPLPWNGISMWRCKAGSIFQFCRFRGFSFAITSAPPYESGTQGTNYSEGLVVRRCEVDGRIAARIDPARPKAGGGWMQNKDIDIRFYDFWEHHTRRSGNAINTNTSRTDEYAYYENFQVDDIANMDVSDTWPSDGNSVPSGFNGWNVEGFLGSMWLINCQSNSSSGQHIDWEVPYSQGAGVTPTPTHTIFHVHGFRTTDTSYGGMLRFKVGKNPNSTGQSPVWTRINSMTIDTSGYFDVRWNVGDSGQMSGVKASQWNARQASNGDAATYYPKDQYFVVLDL